MNSGMDPRSGHGDWHGRPDDAACYLDDVATTTGGRNTRPRAIPALVASYCESGRTLLGAAATVTGALAGIAAWFGLAQLGQPTSSLVLLIVVLALAAGLMATAVVLAGRVVRGGQTLRQALRRWHGIAPEVPVRGVGLLTKGPGMLRIVLAGVAVLAAIGVVVAALLVGTVWAWVGLGMAALWLAAAGIVAGRGWWQVRSLLGTAAPQASHEAFAPALNAQLPAHSDPQHWSPAPQPQPWNPPVQQQPQQPGWSTPQPLPPSEPSPGPQMHPVPSMTTQLPPGWREEAGDEAIATEATTQRPGHVAVPAKPEPAPTPAQQALPQRQSASVAAVQVTPMPVPAAEPAPIPDTLDDATIVGRRRIIAVILDDGTRLPASRTAVVGRDPQPRPEEGDVDVVQISHPTISKTHATLTISSDAVVVTDRASTNGTAVIGLDGTRRTLTRWTPEVVTMGSEILLGSYRVKVTDGS